MIKYRQHLSSLIHYFVIVHSAYSFTVRISAVSVVHMEVNDVHICSQKCVLQIQMANEKNIQVLGKFPCHSYTPTVMKYIKAETYCVAVIKHVYKKYSSLENVIIKFTFVIDASLVVRHTSCKIKDFRCRVIQKVKVCFLLSQTRYCRQYTGLDSVLILQNSEMALSRALNHILLQLRVEQVAEN